MNSILKDIQNPKAFQAFVDENMKVSTFKALWKEEISQVDYEPAKQYKASLAEYGAAIAGSVISKNAEKPVHTLPDFNELFGSIGHYGDQWELDNDYLEQMYYLEGRYRSRIPNYTEEQNRAEYDKLIKYAFQPFERAVIAPHKRLDMLYFEGLFKGTQTVSRTNNIKANVSYTFTLDVTQFKCKISSATWATAADATPIDDIQRVVDYAESKGRNVLRIRMSKNTFAKMCKTNQIKSVFKLDLGRVKVDAAVPLLSVENINTYFQAVGLPTIVVEPNRFVELPNGTSLNMTADDRVVFQCAPNVAVMKIADPLELVDPLDGKTYSQHDDNLVGYWRDKTGRHTDYDMWAQPVFTGINNYFILKTDEKDA
jgi:hypothetical protein